MTSVRVKIVQWRKESEQNKDLYWKSHSLTLLEGIHGSLDLFIYNNASVPHDIFDVIYISQTAISHRQKNTEGG